MVAVAVVAVAVEDALRLLVITGKVAEEEAEADMVAAEVMEEGAVADTAAVAEVMEVDRSMVAVTAEEEVAEMQLN